MLVDKSNILIILPAYNEAEVIDEVLSDIINEGYTNICVVDDGSYDDTGAIAQKHKVTLLTHPVNRGAGAAVQTGIMYARQEHVEYAIMIDSDGQHLPTDIDSLYRKLIETNADIVIGNRFFNSENGVPKKRKFYNNIANYYTNVFCKNNYTDTQSGFRLLNRKAIESLNLKNRGFGFCSEMIILSEKLGLRIEQTPINVYYTEYSLRKGQDFREGIRTARNIMWSILFD